MADESSLVEVELRSVPVAIWARTAEHQESIQREFDIIRTTEPDDSVPNRLQALIEELSARYGEFGEANQRRLREAADRGVDEIDLVYRVPPQAVSAAERLSAMLDEVDEYCRAGTHLLSLATPEPLAAFRRWFLAEFSRQVAGDPPLAWPDHAAAVGVSELPPPAPTGHAVSGDPSAPVIAVTVDLDLASVGALRNTIQRLHNAGARSLTLDLRSVAFTDSVGIGLLVTTSNRLREEGGRLVVLCGNRLRSVLEMAGVAELFDLGEA